MRFAAIPTAGALVLLTFCSPANDRQARESGVGRDNAGGFNSNDTLATSARSDSAAATEAAPTPAGILSELNVTNTTEITLGQLVSKKAASPAVKQIAGRLASDHARNRQHLQALAQKLGLTLTPAQGGNVSAVSGADSANFAAQLEGKSGAEFDKAYVQHEIENHQFKIEKIQQQLLPAAQDQQVKAYLQKTLTEMEGHLAVLKNVDRKISG
jgi:putative membrane protein